MTPHDDRRNSTAANVADGIALGLQVVFEWAGFLIEGVLSLVVGLLG